MLLAIAMLHLLGSDRALLLLQLPTATAAPEKAGQAPEICPPPGVPLLSAPLSPAPKPGGAAAQPSSPGAPATSAAAPQAAVTPTGGSQPASPPPPPSAPPIGVFPAQCSFSGKVTLLREGKAVSPEGRVVVYVRTVPQELWKPTAAPAVKVFQEKISPDDFKFSDSMRVVVIGDAIDFVNKAQDNHNVFSATTMTFEMPESTAYSTGTHRFTQQGTYHVQCDIHESMRLDVLAVKNPFFAPADAQGHYTLSPLPPGEYKLVAWERNGGEVELPVTCPSEKPVDFELREASTPPHRHKDKRPWRGHGGGPW